MPRLLAVDHGQERIVKEYIRGETIDRYVLRDEMRPDDYEQNHAMCQKLYAAGINIDYNPTNFVVQEDVLYYIDYECNGYMEQWDFEHWGYKYWEKTPEFLSAFQK